MQTKFCSPVISVLLLLLSINQACTAQGWANVNGGIQTGIDNFCASLTYTDSGKLYVGGRFATAGGITATNIAEYTPANGWKALGSGFPFHNDNPQGGVFAMQQFQGNLYVGGQFDSVGGILAYMVAMWDGANWHALGRGIPNENADIVNAFILYDTILMVGGNFIKAGTIETACAAIWNGTDWQGTSGLNQNGEGNAGLHSFAIYNDTLYAAGQFAYQVGSSFNFYGLAQWVGGTWVTSGSGMFAAHTSFFPGCINSLCAYKGNLYAAGTFDSIGGVVASNIAMWNGTNWAPVGGGITSADTPYVQCMAVYQGNLVIGGHFDTVGGVPCSNMAVWDGSSWQPYLNPNFQGDLVYALQPGSGLDFYAAGIFTQAGGIPVNDIAVWNEPLSITQVANTGAAKIYPNPNNGSFYVSLPNETTESIINIYDAMGNLFMQTTVSAAKTQIEMNKLATGVYFYQVIATGTNELATGKLVVAGH